MNRTLTLSALLTLAAVLAMGADNSRQLARCEATGRGQAECRLLVLGR
jgi:ribosomal protein S14